MDPGGERGAGAASPRAGKGSRPPAVVSRLARELARRGIEMVYCATGDEARDFLCRAIPPGAEVMTGSSATLAAIGFEEVLRSGDYEYYRPRIKALDDDRERIRLRRRSTTAEYFVGGVNAISLTGEILNVDGSGGRVAGYAYGGGKVYLVAGVNKIAPTLSAAFRRLRNRAAAEECRALGRKTPCASDGVCRNYECYPPERQCGKVLIIEKEGIPGRITLVLIGESLGY
jgi:hypothetical protein